MEFVFVITVVASRHYFGLRFFFFFFPEWPLICTCSRKRTDRRCHSIFQFEKCLPSNISPSFSYSCASLQLERKQKAKTTLISQSERFFSSFMPSDFQSSCLTSWFTWKLLFKWSKNLCTMEINDVCFVFSFILFLFGTGSRIHCWLSYPQKREALLFQVYTDLQALRFWVYDIFLGH